MPKGFSEQEKKNIKELLINHCQESWKKYGYKKTNIEELCKASGISKGAFYIFYQSKEELFYETLKAVQQHLYELTEDILMTQQSKYGVANALKAIYKEYDNSPFLYNTSSEDFVSFVNKLSKEEKDALSLDSLSSARFMFDKSFLTLKMEEDKALSILVSILNIAANKEKMLYNHFEVFEYMLDHLIGEIFE